VRCVGICGMGCPTAVEELLAERGVTVDHVTVYRWVVQTFTPEFVDAARASRYSVGDRWFVEETHIKVPGRWTYLDRAVDQYGQVIDVLVSERRDAGAARALFSRALNVGPAPVEVTTDRAAVYPRVLDELLPGRAAGAQRYRCEHRKVASNARSESPDAQDLVQMQPRLRAPAEVAVQNRWAMASC
jgi:transposase-like protein